MRLIKFIIFCCYFFQPSIAFSQNTTNQKLELITAEQFLAENPSVERKAIIDFIIHQFDDKHEIGITQAKLDELWNNKKAREAFSISRFQIINQKLYADSNNVTHPYFRSYWKYFQNFVKKYQINDVDFIIYTSKKWLRK